MPERHLLYPTCPYSPPPGTAKSVPSSYLFPVLRNYRDRRCFPLRLTGQALEHRRPQSELSSSLITASVISSVVAAPPRSRVLVPAAMVASSASRTRRPASVWPRCSRRSAAAQIAPDGFATSCPAISGAEPWIER